MTISIVQISTLNKEDKQIMFDMYVKSYTMGGQPLWFATQEQLFSRYPCVATIDDQYLKVYAMYQFKTKYNKISLVCHDGSEYGKNLSIALRDQLVRQPGWILEAADKVSWILRDKKKSPIIADQRMIEEALDIVGCDNDKIIMNTVFDPIVKDTYQYERSYYDAKNDKTYVSKETMFGTVPCNYDGQSRCNRTCVSVGGASISKKRRKTSKSLKN